MDITDATNHLRLSQFYHGRKDSTSISNAITKAAVGDAGFVRTHFGQSIKAQHVQVLGLNQKRIPHAASGRPLSRALISRHPKKMALRTYETAAAFEPVAAASSHQTSRGFAPLGAIASLRTCPRGQASSGLDWKGAGNIGRWRGTSTMVRAAGAWTSWTAVLGCWPADRLARSSQGPSCDHWPECELGGFLVDCVCGAGLAGARVEIRPGSQTGRFRSRWRDEVATTGLLVDERARARARIEDQYCRRAYARTRGRPEHLRES